MVIKSICILFIFYKWFFPQSQNLKKKSHETLIQMISCLFQDVNDRNSLHYPKLYTPGHQNLFFNKKEFLKSLAHGVCTSFTLFFVSYGAFNQLINKDGLNMDSHQLLGTVVSTLLGTDRHCTGLCHIQFFYKNNTYLCQISAR